MGKLTTHVLDTSHGSPAVGVRLKLLDGERRVLLETMTDKDGRCDRPLLEGASFRAGKYVLAFSAGDYFRGRGVRLPDPAFLDVIEIAFGISDADGHYHVPLLVSPWSYSTYRGS